MNKDQEENKKITVTEETVNLKELGNIIFPKLEQITAERKVSKNFKKACAQLGVDPVTFKSNKEYRIPKASLKMWTLLIRNIEAVEGNPSQRGYESFVEDVIFAKEEVDEDILDPDNLDVFNDSFQQSMSVIYELFYTSTPHGESIAKLMHNELIKNIQRDLKYIIEKAPADRKVMYTEMYYTEISRKAVKMGDFIRKMIKGKWYEK